MLAPFLGLLLAVATPATPIEILSHGRFERVSVRRPTGTPEGVVLLLAGSHAQESSAVRVADALSRDGALVLTIDVPAFLADLERDTASCVYPDGDLENLSRFVQAYEQLPTYEPPVLVGYGAGAALAYAMIAQATAGTFAGAISLGFCPELPLDKPLCKGDGVLFTVREDGNGMDLKPGIHLEAPWVVLPESEPRACDARALEAFASRVPTVAASPLPGPSPPVAPANGGWAGLASAFHRLAARAAASTVRPPQAISDLPTVEVPSETAGDTFAVMLSGDGGWAGIDKELAAALSKAGVSVVGVDSLRYFWTARTAESTAADVDRLIRYYTARWRRPNVLLVGYSQGADVLPFVVDRLPADTLARVKLAAMLGIGERAEFEFHLSSWLTSGGGGLPIAPEIAKLPTGIGLCVYGTDEKDPGCPGLDPRHIRSVAVPGGHHFGGDYDRLAKLLLDSVPALEAGGGR